MAAGRPTKYKEQYCDDLIKHMTAGADFRSFAGKVGVAEKTLYVWRDTYPAFKEASNLALEKAYAWWEEVIRKGTKPKKGDDPINVGLAVLNMRNRFHWFGKDKDKDKEPEDNNDAFSENYMTWEKRKSER